MVADQASGYATRNYLNYLDRPSWVDYDLLYVFSGGRCLPLQRVLHQGCRRLDRGRAGLDFSRSMGSADGRDANPLQWTPYNDGDYWNEPYWWTSSRTIRISSNCGSTPAEPPALAVLDPESPCADQFPCGPIGPAAARRCRPLAYVPSSYPATWQANIAAMSSWIGKRAQWIDQQFVAAPIVNPVGSTSALLPPAGAQIAYTLDGSDPRL